MASGALGFGQQGFLPPCIARLDEVLQDREHGGLDPFAQREPMLAYHLFPHGYVKPPVPRATFSHRHPGHGRERLGVVRGLV